MTADSKTCVLILYIDLGFGHRRTSSAIVHALNERFSDLDVVMANPFDELSVPARIRSAQADHTRLVRELPQIYSLGLRATDTDLTKGIGSMAGLLILSNAIRDLVDRHAPSVVVVTHPIVIEPLLNYRRNGGIPFQIATVITDLTRPHRLWFDEDVDLYLLPNRSTVGLAMGRDMPVEHLLVTGIPIEPHDAESPETKAGLRVKLGLEADLCTVLVVGSQRVANLELYLQALNSSGLPIQIIAVAGGDESLYEAINAVDWIVPVAQFNLVETMPDLMSAADCILTKAGGLIVAESLANGLPLLITQCIPSHEKGNAEYVVLQGAGEMAQSPTSVVPILERWLQDKAQLLTARAANAARIGRPHAAYDIANIVNLLAEGHEPASDVFMPYRQMD